MREGGALFDLPSGRLGPSGPDEHLVEHFDDYDAAVADGGEQAGYNSDRHSAHRPVTVTLFLLFSPFRASVSSLFRERARQTKRLDRRQPDESNGVVDGVEEIKLRRFARGRRRIEPPTAAAANAPRALASINVTFFPSRPPPPPFSSHRSRALLRFFIISALALSTPPTCGW